MWRLVVWVPVLTWAGVALSVEPVRARDGAGAPVGAGARAGESSRAGERARVGQTEPVRAGDAARAAAARVALVEAVGVIEESGAGVAEAVVRAEGAMVVLRGLVDTSFHAPNLREPGVRVHALALREEVARVLAGQGEGAGGGEGAVMVVVDDVMHFRARVHRALAGAALARGDRAGEVIHRRAVVAVEPGDEAGWVALRDAYLAAGDRRGAAAVEGERWRAVPGEPVMGVPAQ